MAKVRKRAVLKKLKARAVEKIQERVEAAKPKARTMVDHAREKMLERADERRAQRRAKMANHPGRHDDDEEKRKPKPAEKPEPAPTTPDPMSTPPDPPPAPKEPA